jgi:catechol 2,3-dioxygenase-like lactoylglutathione lyase family enzyme
MTDLADSLVGRLGVPGTPSIYQVGIVVSDRDRAVAQYTSLLGITGWRLSDFDEHSAARTIVRGVEAPLSMRLAFAGANPEIELIEPVGGNSIYGEWLRSRGEGIHHLAVAVDSIVDASAALADAGFEELQAGFGFAPSGRGGFAYFETTSELGFILEVVEMP